MRYRILGAVEVATDRAPVPIERPRSRAVLGYLLLHAGQPVPLGGLSEAVWGGAAPATARAQVQADVSAIRRALRQAGSDPLVTSSGGYLLRTAPGEVDHLQFTELVTRAETVDAPDEVASLLRQALRLWRGPALAGVTAAYAEGARHRLDEQRYAAFERLADAELALGRHVELTADLTAAVRTAPLRERLRAHLMLALHRAGRSAEALAEGRDLRQRLVEEHGIDPGRAIIELERRILAGDPDLDPAPPAPRVAALGPVEAPWTVPAALPPDTADFTGRRAEAELMMSLLTRRPPAGLTVVAVDGMGGMGKTALAVHVAHRVAESFPDGQLYVDLAGAEPHPMDPADVLPRLLRATGVDHRAVPHDRDERAHLYRSRLAGRRVLVVLDNAASEEQIRPLLPGTGSCAVLATSRRRLTGVEGARWIDLEVFSDREALDLLGQIADHRRVRAEPDDAAAIVRLCGRLPLAVRVAGARLAARRTWPLARLVTSLADERRRLDGLTAGDLAVRSTLASSYRALDEPTRRLARLLSLFDAPSLPSWLAAALLDVPVDRAEEILERLVDAQLLADAGRDAAGQVRYRYHDLVRLYARERALAEDGAGPTRAALLRGFGAWLHLSEAMAALIPGPCYIPVHGSAPRTPVPGWDHPVDALAWFKAEQHALVSAVRQAADAGLVEVAFDLAGCLEKYFDIRGMYAAWRDTNEYVLAACRRAGHRLGEAVMLRGLIDVRTWHSSSPADEAMAAMESDALRLAALFAEAGEERGVADAAVDLAWALAAQGRYEDAADEAARALRLAERYDHLGGRARAHVAAAIVDGERGRFDDSLGHLAAALRLARELGNPRYEATVLQFLGIRHTRAGDPVAAERVLTESLAILRRYGDRYAEVLTLLTLARARMARGDRRARESAEAALTTARMYVAPHHIADALGVLGEIHLREGDHRLARSRLEESVQRWRARGWPSFLADALTGLGRALADADPDAARRAWSEAREIYLTLELGTKAAEVGALLGTR